MRVDGSLDLVGGKIFWNDIDLTGASPADIGAVATATLAEVGSPTGFVTYPTMSFTYASLNLTLTLGGSFSFYHKGTKYTKSGDSFVLPNPSEGLHFFYYDGGTLTHSTNPWSLSQHAPVVLIYWDSTNMSVLNWPCYEMHGSTMDWATHLYNHLTRGTAYASGFGISGYTLGTDTAAAVSFGIGNGVIFDEDIQIAVNHSNSPSSNFEQILNDPAQLPVLYRSGASGNWRKVPATSLPFTVGPSSRVAFNEYTGSTWQLTDVASTNFCVYYVVATNMTREPIVLIPGQTQYSSITLAQGDMWQNLSFGTLPFAEFKVLYRVIFEVKTTYTAASGYSKLQDVQDLRASLAGGSVAAVATAHSSLSGLSNKDHPFNAIQEVSVSGASDAQALTYDAASSLWKNKPVPTEYNYSISGQLSVATGNLRRYVNGAKTVTKIVVAVGTAPVGSGVSIDVRKNGVAGSIVTSNPTIAAGSNSVTVTTINSPNLADGDYLTVDVITVGSTTPGSDLTVTIRC